MLLAKGDARGGLAMQREAFRILVATAGPMAMDTLVCANNLAVLDCDPIEEDRRVAGEEVAEQLRQVLAEQAERKSKPPGS